MRKPVLALLLLVALPLAAAAESADEVIARNLAARGGKERVEAVRTRRLSGKLGTSPILVELSSPDRIREEIHFEKGVLIRVYNAGRGWQISPFGSDPGVTSLTGDDLRFASEEADEDSFVGYQTKGHRVEVVGHEEVEGHPAVRLRVTLHNGDVHDYLFDTATGLKLRWEATRHYGDQTMVLQSTFRDYRAVDGVLFAFHIDSGRKGETGSQALVFERIEVNPHLDPSRFDQPAAPGSAAPPH